MDKSWYKSKTIQGVAVVTILGALQQLGIGDASITVNVLQTLGIGWGVYGFRDALK